MTWDAMIRDELASKRWRVEKAEDGQWITYRAERAGFLFATWAAAYGFACRMVEADA